MKNHKTKMKNHVSKNKKGMSQALWFILGMGLIMLLIIVVYMFLGDSTSTLKRLITQMFG
ncbi:MAG: hypothetical protein ACP5N2_06780 [Candidatus Nanoarchaeia archaeon]